MAPGGVMPCLPRSLSLSSRLATNSLPQLFHSQERRRQSLDDTSIAPKTTATSHEPKSHVNHPSIPSPPTRIRIPGNTAKDQRNQEREKRKKGKGKRDGEKEPPPRTSLFWTSGTQRPFDPDRITHGSSVPSVVDRLIPASWSTAPSINSHRPSELRAARRLSTNTCKYGGPYNQSSSAYRTALSPRKKKHNDVLRAARTSQMRIWWRSPIVHGIVARFPKESGGNGGG
ncbi:hypothetical protein QBC39DRAFT_81661 [Podospora conica]|nr:hypothetical protein QBC39DRAFT_81661 [Schizothecium conicum]